MKLKFNGFLALLLVLITQITFAQDITVNGVVQDQAGLPIPGVNVLVKGTTNGVQTDFDGKYQLKAAPGSVLVFSFLGMKTQERPATANMTVKMADDSVQLEGVVVTAFGIKRQKRELGYATTSVSSKDLTEVTNTNVFESLSGKMAGVDITAPAQVGASSKVIIRGFSSFQGNSPLYVVDGTPITNSNISSSTGNTRTFDAGNGISEIDPNNIETMTVLKGAAATALYGSRGGQGVILITTKSGKNKSKISVELSNSTDFSEVARVPKLQNQFGQGWAGASYSTWAGHPENTASNENGSWGPAFNGEDRPWGTIINNAQQIKPYVALEDNVRDFYETGRTYTNNVRVFGGGDNSNFSLSYSDVNADGIVPTDADSFNRKALGFNAGMNSDKLSVKASFNYIRKIQNAINTGQGSDSGEGNTMIQELLQIPRDISVVDLQDYNNNPFNTPSNYFTPYATNPYFVVNENSTKIDGNRLYGNINLNYMFNKHLSLSYQAGGDYSVNRIKSYGALVRYDEGSAQALGGANEIQGGVTEANNEVIEFDTNTILNYNKNINEDFNFNGLIGFNTNERRINQLSASVTNLEFANFYELSNTSIKPVTFQNNSLRRSFGAFASLETSWKNKIFLTVTGRNDWTSTLAQGNNSYFYPSVSASGVVIETDKHFLKLRAGYASIANDVRTPYLTTSGLVPGNAALGFGSILLPFGGVNGYEFSNTLGNPDLEPEKVNELEFGLEGQFFNRRLNLDASFYNKKSSGLIFTRPVAASTGYAFQTENLIDMTNKGVELVLTVLPVRTENFTWEFTTTFTKNESEVTDIKGGEEKVQLASNYGVTYNAVLGQPLGEFDAFVPKLSPSGQPIVDAATGFYKASDDEQKVGNSQRDFVMGFKNRVTWKNLTLAFGIDWKQGGEMYSYTKRLSHFVGNGIETTYNDRNPFIIPNSVVEVTDVDGNVTGYEENTSAVAFESVTDYWNPQNNAAIEQGHVIDKTFVRLRDLSLTYNFPADPVKRLGLVNASISLYGKNLFLWTPDDNPYVDPELSTFGDDLGSEVGEFGTNPSQRSYGLNVKLTF